MGMAEALGLRLVELHVRPLLPTPMVQSMEGLFDLAKQKLAQSSGEELSRPANWLTKVRSVPATQPLLAPTVLTEVHAAICQALLEGRQLDADYHAMGTEEAKPYRLHPLGLIARGTVLYLVATAWDYLDIRLYAFHRFATATAADQAARVPDGFDLDRAVAGGLAEFSDQGEAIWIELRCAPPVARHLQETQLAADQEVWEEPDGWMHLGATVNDTWQLRWWLLSQGALLEVTRPETLREAIAETLRTAAGYYGKAEAGRLDGSLAKHRRKPRKPVIVDEGRE